MKGIILLFILPFIYGSPTPIVLWHGMGDTCCVYFSLGALKQFLEDQIPGVYVTSLRIGNNTIEDFENGYFMSPFKQLEYAYENITKDPKLKDGFNAIGFSQGGQFLRGLVQVYGHKLPPVKNLISLGGQHQGVYGLPRCDLLRYTTCDYIRKLLNYAAYESWVQDYLVQATYWHDPLNEQKYKDNSKYLSIINNERTINATYVSNLKKLEHLVLVKFDNDTIVQPRETEWFGYYKPGQSKEIQTLQESDIYTQDRLGLKEMEESGKLIFRSSPGDHLRFNDTWFINNVIPYLK